MAAKDTGPLDWRIAIVDKSGRPTQEFQRRWATQRNNNALIGAVTLGLGAPTGTPDDGAEYVDTSTTPFTVYFGKDGTWHKADVTKFIELTDVPSSYVGNSKKLLRVKSTEDKLEFFVPTANPTATASDTAVNGTADTYMRSDGAPAVQKGTSSQFGLVKVDGTTITSVAGVISSVGGGGGGPTVSPAIRASNIQSSSAASYTVTWPTGTVLNDIVLIFYGGGFQANVPTGWTSLYTGTGSNYNGKVLAKKMTAGDISTGSVTVTTGGTFNATLSAITINGATWGSLAAVSGEQNASGTLTSSLNALGIFYPTTMALYWGASRGALNVTVVAGGSSVQQALNAANSSGALYAGVPTSALFGVAGTFNYSASGSGFSDVIITVTGV